MAKGKDNINSLDLLGTTELCFIVTRHIKKDDPLFKLAKKGLENLRKKFEALTDLLLKIQKYEIIKQPDGTSKIIGIYNIYNKKNKGELNG